MDFQKSYIDPYGPNGFSEVIWDFSNYMDSVLRTTALHETNIDFFKNKHTANVFIRVIITVLLKITHIGKLNACSSVSACV